MVEAGVRIRDATATDGPMLEDLQRRASYVWEEYREQLAARPDVIALPAEYIANGWVRVAVDDEQVPIGFSVFIPERDGMHELDGLFVEPARMFGGIGRALVEDGLARAAKGGATSVEVTAGPAQGFYEKVGFHLVGSTETLFGPAVRLRRALDQETKAHM
jgi:GNAT superfamily N-acetyltransferase